MTSWKPCTIHCPKEVPWLLSNPVSTILEADVRGKVNIFFDSVIYLTKNQLNFQLNTEAHLKEVHQVLSKVEVGTVHFELAQLH